MGDGNRIICGMQIIMKHEPDADTAAEHDIIYFGGAVEINDADDLLKLKELGWHYDKDLESWYHFV